MQPKFSVIVPVYNVKDYLKRCVDSVLRQDEADLELILVDDGSTDGSSKLCDVLAKEDPRTQVLHKPNGGLASARNAGIAAAKGQYLLFFDSDDWVEPDTLRTIADAFGNGGPDIVRFDLALESKGKRVNVYATNAPAGLYADGSVQKKLLEQALLTQKGFHLSACGHAYRKDFLTANGLKFVSEREVLSEDYLFNLCALMTAKDVYITNKVLYHYDMREGSLTHKVKPNMMERYTELYRRLEAFAKEQGMGQTLIRKIRTYYVMNLIYSVTIAYEYCDGGDQTFAEARKRVKRILNDKTVRFCAKTMYVDHLPPKERVRAELIRMRCEPALAFLFRKWAK